MSLGLGLAIFSLTGCGDNVKPPPPAPALTALSLEEWRQLPIDQKYDGATFDRLRMSDPRLQDERAWLTYMARHIIPERKQDIPGTPGQPLPPGP